ncbi:MAG: phage tail protein [Fluviibacter sp.]
MTTSPTVERTGLLSDPIRNFRFLAQITQHDNSTIRPTIGFTNISGFGITVDPIAYREGGYNTTTHWMPGQATFEPIQFVRGTVLGSSQNHNWMRQLFTVVQGNGASGAGVDFRCTIDVAVLSHPNPKNTKALGANGVDGDLATTLGDQHVSMRFRIYNAWISSLAYGDLSATGNGIMVEGMTVVHEGFDVIYASNYNSTAATFQY